MNPVLLDAKADLERNGLIVRPSGEEALLVAATVVETGDGLGVSPDASMIIRQGDGWVAVFPAEGHRTYEVPGELPGLLALVRAVYDRYRRGGGPLREAFRRVVPGAEVYLAGEKGPGARAPAVPPLPGEWDVVPGKG
jgi:hypothetical protein